MLPFHVRSLSIRLSIATSFRGVPLNITQHLRALHSRYHARYFHLYPIRNIQVSNNGGIQEYFAKMCTYKPHTEAVQTIVSAFDTETIANKRFTILPILFANVSEFSIPLDLTT